MGKLGKYCLDGIVEVNITRSDIWTKCIPPCNMIKGYHSFILFPQTSQIQANPAQMSGNLKDTYSALTNTVMFNSGRDGK